LLVFCALLGAYANIVFAPHVQRQYRADWSDATWIGISRARSVAYFRKELVIASPPAKAYLQVAAPDAFDLYVNGMRIAGQGLGSTAVMVSASASAIFDISSSLNVGRNVLAVAVRLQTRPAQPQLIVRGRWRDQTGETHAIVSDASWRVAATEEWQAGRTIAWSHPDFIDAAWPFAVELAPLVDRPTQYLDLPPALFEVLPQGQWVWNEERSAQKAAFLRRFSLQGEQLEEAWIGISSDAGYALAVNDMLVNAARGTTSMHTYNVGRYLRWGKNKIAVAATATPPLRAPRLAVALVANVDGNWLDFSTDHRWLSSSGDERGSRWTPAAIAGRMSSVPLTSGGAAPSTEQFGYPALEILQVSPPLAWWLGNAANSAAWCAILLATGLALTWLVAFARYRRAPTIGLACVAWPHASVAGCLVLCFLFLMQFDVRIQQPLLFQPAVFFAVWVAACLWAVLTLVGAPASWSPKATNA
jgi:hypothetical protein